MSESELWATVTLITIFHFIQITSFFFFFPISFPLSEMGLLENIFSLHLFHLDGFAFLLESLCSFLLSFVSSWNCNTFAKETTLFSSSISCALTKKAENLPWGQAFPSPWIEDNHPHHYVVLDHHHPSPFVSADRKEDFFVACQPKFLLLLTDDPFLSFFQRTRIRRSRCGSEYCCPERPN